MPANLVPNTAIPELARSTSSDELDLLRHIQGTGYIQSDAVDEHQFATLQRLAVRGLVDQGFTAATDPKPWIWVSNGNGSRVLRYLTGIRSGPHYEVLSSELATWLEDQGKDRCWNVDGDPLLTGRMSFPCPAEELARELREIGRPLLVQAKKDDKDASGQVVGKEKLDAVTERFGENVHFSDEKERPAWGRDRFLYLCWKGTSHEWLLAEDSETTEQMHGEDGQDKGIAEMKRE
jgi:hypothetical protein